MVSLCPWRNSFGKCVHVVELVWGVVVSSVHVVPFSAAKSSDGVNPYFAHNIYIYIYILAVLHTENVAGGEN